MTKREFLFATALCSGLLLAGCGGQKGPTVYDIPKEDTAPPPPAATAMSQQSLPDGAVNQSGNPAWTIPAHWEEAPASQMRKASFTVPAAEGAVDVSVTSFPGAVGGTLANVNRWRRQLGLPPVGEEEVPTYDQPIEGAHHPASLADITNGETRTLAATIFVSGNSWFFKMSGPAAAVAREESGFLDFVRSVDFHQHAHPAQ